MMEEVPIDIFWKIFRYLYEDISQRNLVHLRLVSKKWCDMINNCTRFWNFKYPQYKVVSTSQKDTICVACVLGNLGCVSPRCFNGTLYKIKTLQRQYVPQSQILFNLATKEREYLEKKRANVLKEWVKIRKRKAKVNEKLAENHKMVDRYKKKARKK